MMNRNQRRDLLVLMNNEYRSSSELDQQVEWLHDMLYHVEQLDNFCHAHELILINSHKIIINAAKIKKAVLRRQEKPFEFLSNLN
jgi:hypothetical protein